MLTFLNLIQLVLYIALLALLGQAVLHVLAGAGRESNPFYRVLQLVGSPFTRAVRRLLPPAAGAARVAWVTFLLLALLYGVATWARTHWCLAYGLLGQAGCR